MFDVWELINIGFFSSFFLFFFFSFLFLPLLQAYQNDQTMSLLQSICTVRELLWQWLSVSKLIQTWTCYRTYQMPGNSLKNAFLHPTFLKTCWKHKPVIEYCGELLEQCFCLSQVEKSIEDKLIRGGTFEKWWHCPSLLGCLLSCLFCCSTVQCSSPTTCYQTTLALCLSQHWPQVQQDFGDTVPAICFVLALWTVVSPSAIHILFPISTFMK